MSSESFYLDLSEFREFEMLTNIENYEDVPDDWHIVITDVKGSTQAIEEGRYKDVNTVGAASIVAAQNAMNGTDFPFVFGGDGATLLIPPQHIDATLKQLVALKKLSNRQFNLDLRVGCVPVKEIYAEGGILKTAKFAIIGSRCVAIFQGGGLMMAEDKIKKENEKYEVKLDDDEPADLSGLSCRWRPIDNKNGQVLSLLIATQHEDDGKTYGEIINHLNHVFEGEIENANPINVASMNYRTIGDCMNDEIRYHKNKLSLSFLFRLVEIFMAVFIFKFHIPPFFFDPNRYKNSMKTHSDYRKFDEMLRMIIDVTPEQANAIESYLKDLYSEDRIFYGVHSSNQALMTCFVQGLDDSEHIHFVDGGDGGYAMAAKGLKEQMKTAQKLAA